MNSINILNEYLNNPDKYGSLYIFLRFYASDIIPDIKRAHPFLTNDMDDYRKTEVIKNCIKTRSELETHRIHKKNKQLNPYEYFCKFNDSFVISKKDFETIYSSVCGIEFNGSLLDCKKNAMDAINILRTIEAPDEELLSCLNILLQSQIPNKAAYMLPFKNDEELESNTKAFGEILKSLKRNRDYWRDALCCFSYNRLCNDTDLENRFVYYKFTESIEFNKPDDEVYIIEPSPLFIRQWIYDSPLYNVRTTFVIRDYNALSILKYAYGESSTVKFISIYDLSPALRKGSPRRCLFFSGHLDSNDEKRSILHVLFEGARDIHTIFVLDSDSFICSLAEFNYPKTIKSLRLLPSDINYSAPPKRKILAELDFGYINDEAKETKVISYKTDKTGRYQRLDPKPYTSTLTDINIADKIKRLRRQIWEESRLFEKKTDQIREKAHRYKFSREISFLYTASQGEEKTRIKVRAEFDCNGVQTAIAGSNTEKRSITALEIPVWLESVYPFLSIKKNANEATVQNLISSFLKEHQIKDISFKTLLYFYPDATSSITDNQKTVLYNLCAFLGEYSLSQISQARLKDAVDSAVLEGITNSPSATASALKSVFGYAKLNKLCRFNPAEELIIRNNDRFKAMDDVLNALGKHFFTEDESNCIYKKCICEIEKKNYIYIAVILRLTTGLETNIICGLLWGDFLLQKTIKGKKYYYLNIVKYLNFKNRVGANFLAPLTPPYVPFGIRRFNSNNNLNN